MSSMNEKNSTVLKTTSFNGFQFKDIDNFSKQIFGMDQVRGRPPMNDIVSRELLCCIVAWVLAKLPDDQHNLFTVYQIVSGSDLVSVLADGSKSSGDFDVPTSFFSKFSSWGLDSDEMIKARATLISKLDDWAARDKLN